MKSRMLLALTAGLSLAACVREGRIALPSDVAASAERIELTGISGGTRGGFRLGEARGTFRRSAERLALFDPLLVRNSGGGRFTIHASPLGPELSGRCRWREGEVNAGPVAVTPKRLVYHCGFAREGRPIAAELRIEDPSSAFGTLHGRAERIGSLHLEGRELGIRSIHHDAGGGLPAPTALGYAFDEDGRQIGAVDLNGLDKTLWVPRDPALREAVIAAGLALSILWDPAAVRED